jgi:PleD family two-component response regulator
MDGVRLTESIRAAPALAGAGIVVVTSRDDETTRARTMIAGADAYLVVNDGHGHAAGDAVLQQLAPRLRTRLRHEDGCGRRPAATGPA